MAQVYIFFNLYNWQSELEIYSLLLFLQHRYDIVLDATDNVATRYLLNDACVLAGKPLVSGSALRFEGQVRIELRTFLLNKI